MNEPNQIPGTVEMVSVGWLLKNIHFSADYYNNYDSTDVDWADLLDGKIWDSSFPDIVYSITTRGFRVPICLYPNPQGRDWALGNGHHRMSAAILMFLDEIPVFWSDDDYMSTHKTDTEGLAIDPDGHEFQELLRELFT